MHLQEFGDRLLQLLRDDDHPEVEGYRYHGIKVDFNSDVELTVVTEDDSVFLIRIHPARKTWEDGTPK
jgi:hypothetical protein